MVVICGSLNRTGGVPVQTITVVFVETYNSTHVFLGYAAVVCVEGCMYVRDQAFFCLLEPIVVCLSIFFSVKRSSTPQNHFVLCRRKLAHDNNISSVHVNFCAEEEVCASPARFPRFFFFL